MPISSVRYVTFLLSIGIFVSCAAFCKTSGRREKPPKKAAADAGRTAQDLTELSLESLMNNSIQVTCVSKKKERGSEVAAALFVITGDGIRRLGATTLAEALRLAPGMEKARMSSMFWSISARGFNDIRPNKLLVLVDGRPVYSTAYSTVFWYAVDVPPEDVDRIEIVRGPGGTLWGENAVKAVVNIITKSAKDTQGGLVSVAVGTEERGLGAIRYGGKLSDNSHYRIYGKYSDRDSSWLVPKILGLGDDARDRWRLGFGGFRIDSVWDGDELTILGEYEDGSGDTIFPTYSLRPPREETERGVYAKATWQF